jgi:hypothetical protein
MNAFVFEYRTVVALYAYMVSTVTTILYSIPDLYGLDTHCFGCPGSGAGRREMANYRTVILFTLILVPNPKNVYKLIRFTFNRYSNVLIR